MPRSGRPDIIPFLIFSAAQLFYIYTLAPGLLWGDSANFQRLAFTLDFQSEYAYAVLYPTVSGSMPYGRKCIR